MPINGIKAFGELNELEKLMNQIFVKAKYNRLVRPFNRTNGLTHITTELKLLQLDLVCNYIKNISSI